MESKVRWLIFQSYTTKMMCYYFPPFFKQGRKTSTSKAFREKKSIKAKPDSSGREVRRKKLAYMNGHWIAAKNEILILESARSTPHIS